VLQARSEDKAQSEGRCRGCVSARVRECEGRACRMQSVFHPFYNLSSAMMLWQTSTKHSISPDVLCMSSRYFPAGSGSL
jgi:hypothetical protein